MVVALNCPPPVGVCGPAWVVPKTLVAAARSLDPTAASWAQPDPDRQVEAKFCPNSEPGKGSWRDIAGWVFSQRIIKGDPFTVWIAVIG